MDKKQSGLSDEVIIEIVHSVRDIMVTFIERMLSKR